jgi:hypothetical protein
MKRWIPSITLVATLTALAGCGGSAVAQAGGGSASDAKPTSTVAVPRTSWDVSALPSPCRTITTTEIAGIVGGTVKAGVVLTSWPPLFQFVLDPQAHTYLYISDDSAATGRTDYDAKRAGSTKTEAVTGIGDQAYWQADLAALHVLSGATHVFVGFGGTPAPADAKEKALALARVILPRAKPQ